MQALQENEVCDVGILEELRDRNGRESVMVFGPDQDLLAVTFHSESFGPQHPPGWYAMAVEPDGFKSLIENELFGRLGTRFFDVLIDIARELQADVDADALIRGREQASASRPER